MKRIIIIAVMIATSLIMLSGCGSSPEFEVETAPKYKDEVAYPITLKVTEDGEPVQGMDILATLEMAKMDHGIIEVNFTDVGDGTYSGEVELPMGGEWIANIEAELNGDTFDDVVTFDVKEE